MPSILTDQNFNEAIVRGLRRRLPGVPVASVRQFGYEQAPDEDVLALAAVRGDILLTHDAKTIQPLFYRQLADARAVPFTIVVPERADIGEAVELLELILTTTPEADWLIPTLVRLPV